MPKSRIKFQQVSFPFLWAKVSKFWFILKFALFQVQSILSTDNFLKVSVLLSIIEITMRRGAQGTKTHVTREIVTGAGIKLPPDTDTQQMERF